MRISAASLRHSLSLRLLPANMLSIVQRSCSFSRVIGSTEWRGFWRLLSSQRGLRLVLMRLLLIGLPHELLFPLVPGNNTRIRDKPVSLSVKLVSVSAL